MILQYNYFTPSKAGEDDFKLLNCVSLFALHFKKVSENAGF